MYYVGGRVRSRTRRSTRRPSGVEIAVRRTATHAWVEVGRRRPRRRRPDQGLRAARPQRPRRGAAAASSRSTARAETRHDGSARRSRCSRFHDCRNSTSATTRLPPADRDAELREQAPPRAPRPWAPAAYSSAAIGLVRAALGDQLQQLALVVRRASGSDRPDGAAGRASSGDDLAGRAPLRSRRPDGRRRRTPRRRRRGP